MAHDVWVVGDVRVLRFDTADAAPPRDDDAGLLIVAARERDATWIALPPEQRHDDFFRLDTCVAGHLVQKLINYGVKLAVVGDIDAPLARSRALRALVRETNRGDAFWFVADFDALAQRLCECGRIARTRRVGTR